jgi:hypothetical protein
MWSPPPPNLILIVIINTLSTLFSGTWGFLWAKPLIAISKLLKRSAVTLKWRLIAN